MGDRISSFSGDTGGGDAVIQMTFSQAVGLYAGISLLGIFVVWLLFEFHPLETFSFTRRYFWRCSVCTFPYMDSLSDDFSRCPHCQSLNEREKKE